MDIERSFNNIEDRKTYVQVPPRKEEELLLVPRGEGGKMLCGHRMQRRADPGVVLSHARSLHNNSAFNMGTSI